MADPRLTNLARILVEYSTKVKKGDRVAIFTQPVAMPLVEAIYRQVLKAGGYPYVQLGGLRSRVETEELEYLLFTEGSDEQIQHVNQFEKQIREDFEVFISLYSQSNTRGLSSVSPEKQRMRALAYKDVVRAYQERSATRDLRWVLSMYPTAAYAQDAEMSLEEFADYVFSTTYADSKDPIGAWQRIHDEQQKLVDWLKGKKKLEVKGPNVDLELSIDGRDFINSDGERNMPSGEIYTSPIEDSTEGWVRFSYPAIRQAREVDGIELTFEKGRVVKASATKNEDFLRNMLDTDEGARYLGEFAIGTNKRIDRFIKSILFDEKIGGTIHMAVGFGFPEIGGKNVSAIHWDMICDMRDGGQILADGDLIYESGEFKI
ncbi:MAG: aminopeptidase [Anaerolineales bacterium]|jgi:aminopeptidase